MHFGYTGLVMASAILAWQIATVPGSAVAYAISPVDRHRL
jgi:hypothetical protein